MLHGGSCDCPEARLLRAVLSSPAGVDLARELERFATSLAVWKLRSMAHDLAAAEDWTRTFTRAGDRDVYDTPPLSAEEIRARTAASWEKFERDHGYR